MNAASPLATSPVTDSRSITTTVSHPVKLTGSSYQQLGATTPKSRPIAERQLPELTTFRALTKDVFGVKAGREYIKEAVAFAFLMAVAAWPLSITLDMLGTMMISPPAW